MAWQISNREVAGVQDADPQVTIIMESISDASDLPTTGIAVGSMALVADSGLSAYMFGPDHEWHNVD